MLLDEHNRMGETAKKAAPYIPTENGAKHVVKKR
jgi:hypothetical protein